MRMFASNAAQRIMASDVHDNNVPLESKVVTRAIASAQRQIESRNYEIRKNVLKYDDVMTEQREKVYDERHRVLKGEDLEPQVEAFRSQAVGAIVAGRTAEGRSDEWDLDALWNDLGHLYPVGLTRDELVDAVGGLDRLTSERLSVELSEDVAVAYEDAERRMNENPLARTQLGDEPMRTLERRVLLAVVDKRWREHLYEMDYLKEGIGLRAMAQRDPLVEYANEGAHMFKAMMEGIREETIEQIFANVGRFDAAAARAAEDGTAEAAATVAAADGTAAARLKVGAVGSGSAGGGVLGSTGQESMSRRVTYSAPSEDGTATSTTSGSAWSAAGSAGASDSSSSSSSSSSRVAAGRARASADGASRSANRAQRRAAKKKRRH